MSNKLSDRYAPSRVDLHQIVQYVDALCRQPLWNGKPTRLNLAINHCHVVGRVVEWKTATQQCIEQHTHAPHIDLEQEYIENNE